MMLDIAMSDSERIIMIKTSLNTIFMMFIAIVTYIKKFLKGGHWPPRPPGSAPA